MLIYMAAVQETRRDRENKTVWRFLSDGGTFLFACLDDDRKLLTSRPLIWRDDKSVILSQIDTILLDAIQSSPHKTPIKVKNPNLRAYKKYVTGSWKIGGDSEDEGNEGSESGEGDDENEGEIPLVNVIRRDGHIILREQRRRDSMDMN